MRHWKEEGLTVRRKVGDLNVNLVDAAGGCHSKRLPAGDPRAWSANDRTAITSTPEACRNYNVNLYHFAYAWVRAISACSNSATGSKLG